MVLPTDAIDRHLVRPFVQRVQLLRGRVADAIDELERNAQLDQYPARRVPHIYTRMFGPIVGPITPRSDSASAIEQEVLGTPARPSLFTLPRNGNILVGRDGRFTWCRTVVHSYMSLTWTSDPGDLATAVRAWGTPAGDIFDDVVRGNGGALLMDQHAYVPTGLTNPATATSRAIMSLAWRMGLYDKRRDRYMHDGDSLPSSVFTGGSVDNKLTAHRGRFEEDSEIEPRLYVDALVSLLNFTAGDLAAIKWRAYFTISFIGFLEQNQDRGMRHEPDEARP